MKKLLISLLGIVLVVLAVPQHKALAEQDGCVTIQDGVLTYSAGHYFDGYPITLGYDVYGYNYQGRMFKGFYANVYLGQDGFPPYQGDAESYEVAYPDVVVKWYWPYRDVRLIMKWNDAWLSNKDCDGDGVLDRHFPFSSYIGSGAWETNHQFGSYVDEDGNECQWNYFAKIVAVPSDAYEDNGVWYSADGTEIGPEIWGAFAIIQQVENDPCAGIHGLQFVSPEAPGLGRYK